MSIILLELNKFFFKRSGNDGLRFFAMLILFIFEVLEIYLVYILAAITLYGGHLYNNAFVSTAIEFTLWNDLNLIHRELHQTDKFFKDRILQQGVVTKVAVI